MKPCGSSGSTCWYSSSSPPGVSTSPVARPPPTALGWSSRRGTLRSTSTNGNSRCGSSSTPATASSAVLSMTCSQARGSKWSALPSGHLAPTLSASAGSEPSRPSASDWLLIFSRRHLERVLKVYSRHYNRQRPHRALQLQPSEREEFEKTPLPVDARVCRRDRLGGLLHEYYGAAA